MVLAKLADDYRHLKKSGGAGDLRVVVINLMRVNDPSVISNYALSFREDFLGVQASPSELVALSK